MKKKIKKIFEKKDLTSIDANLRQLTSIDVNVTTKILLLYVAKNKAQN
jgi:hypothetical protein